MTGDAPQLVFVHVPKTGGYALHAALDRALPAGSVLRIGNAEHQQAFRAMSAADAARYAMISGHFTLEEAFSRARPGARFATLLRDPVARLISAFNYMASWPGHPLHEQFRTLPFADFIGGSGDRLSGQACLQLTGQPTAAAAIPILEARFALVGTSKRLDDVSRLLHGWLGLPPRVAERENVTAGQGILTMTSETCEQLLRVTVEDRLLYRHVVDRHGGLMMPAAA